LSASFAISHEQPGSVFHEHPLPASRYDDNTKPREALVEKPCTARGGTAIAAIWTPDEMVIAADSADNEILQGELRPVGSACKIRIYGNFVFAVKGMHRAEPDLDVYSIAERVLCGDRSLADAVECLKERLKGPLQTAGAHLRETDWRAFEHSFTSWPLEVVVATNQGGNLQMGGVRAVKHDGQEFSLTMEGRHFRVEACDRLLLPPSYAGLEAYHKQHRDSNPGDLVSTARNFVQFMVDRKEPGVRPPIDVIQITRSTRGWVECKLGCGEIS
jgi:hypothetical protein